MTRSVPNNPLTLGAISSRRGHIPMRVQRRSLGTIMVYTSLKKTLDYLLCGTILHSRNPARKTIPIIFTN